MDPLTFVSNAIASLAWPTAAITLALLFRSSLEKLLERMITAKLPGFEAEFDQGLRYAEQQADQAHLPPPPAQVAILDDRPPSSRVFESWMELESLLTSLYKRSKGEEPRRYTDMREFLFELGREGKIPRESIGIFNNLRSIRNQAVHPKAEGSEMTQTQADEFSVLTWRLMEMLKVVG